MITVSLGLYQSEVTESSCQIRIRTWEGPNLRSRIEGLKHFANKLRNTLYQVFVSHDKDLV